MPDVQSAIRAALRLLAKSIFICKMVAIALDCVARLQLSNSDQSGRNEKGCLAIHASAASCFDTRDPSFSSNGAASAAVASPPRITGADMSLTEPGYSQPSAVTSACL